MAINPPTGKEKPLVNYGSPYLNDVQAVQAEVQKAEYEGREPVLDGIPQEAIDVVLVKPVHDPTVDLESVDEVTAGNIRNAQESSNKPDNSTIRKEEAAKEPNSEDEKAETEAKAQANKETAEAAEAQKQEHAAEQDQKRKDAEAENLKAEAAKADSKPNTVTTKKD